MAGTYSAANAAIGFPVGVLTVLGVVDADDRRAVRASKNISVQNTVFIAQDRDQIGVAKQAVGAGGRKSHAEILIETIMNSARLPWVG
ncbi:hypothetical protein [Blastochloris sulfoviridis]|uniref:hypothetical protein n=1 Tax=Blastochloris sulfoviridis TaxID=50712 RepID=UPI0014793488|nr:hypothetical protein [Blastochloris sulfoviridis]